MKSSKALATLGALCETLEADRLTWCLVLPVQQPAACPVPLPHYHTKSLCILDANQALQQDTEHLCWVLTQPFLLQL